MSKRYPYPHRSSKCGRQRCQRVLFKHIDGRCPKNPRETFLVSQPWKAKPDHDAPKRASLSFSKRQAHVLAEVLAMVARGGDPRIVAKMHAQELGAVHRLVSRARKRLETSAALATASAVNQSAPPPTTALDACSGVGATDPARAVQQ